MEESEILPIPNFWYLEVTDENRDIVNNWRKSIVKYSDDDCPYNYINQVGCGFGRPGRKVGLFWGEQKITTAQFKKYVLGVEESKAPFISEPENYDYLIDFFKKLNIK